MKQKSQQGRMHGPWNTSSVAIPDMRTSSKEVQAIIVKAFCIGHYQHHSWLTCMYHIGNIVLYTHCVMMSSFDKVQEVEYKTAFVETKCVKSRGTFYAYDTATSFYAPSFSNGSNGILFFKLLGQLYACNMARSGGNRICELS